MPLNKAVWADSLGMVGDKSGTNWMINIAGVAAEFAVTSNPVTRNFGTTSPGDLSVRRLRKISARDGVRRPRLSP